MVVPAFAATINVRDLTVSRIVRVETVDGLIATYACVSFAITEAQPESIIISPCSDRGAIFARATLTVSLENGRFVSMYSVSLLVIGSVCRHHAFRAALYTVYIGSLHTTYLPLPAFSRSAYH